MMIYEQASSAGIPISGAGMRRHLPHSTPPTSGYSLDTSVLVDDKLNAGISKRQ
jgi:hypothetical protein